MQRLALFAKGLDELDLLFKKNKDAEAKAIIAFLSEESLSKGFPEQALALQKIIQNYFLVVVFYLKNIPVDCFADIKFSTKEQETIAALRVLSPVDLIILKNAKREEQEYINVVKPKFIFIEKGLKETIDIEKFNKKYQSITHILDNALIAEKA